MEGDRRIEPWADLYAQQVMLEREAASRARAQMNEAEGARAARFGCALREPLAPLEQAIAGFVAEAMTRNPSRRPIAATLLEALGDPGAAAFITLQAALSAAAGGGALTALAAEIGGRIEDEMRLRRLRRAERRLFDHLEARSRSLSAYRAKRALFLNAAARANRSAARWVLRDRTLLGVKLVELAIEATGLFVTALAKKSRGGRLLTIRILQGTETLTGALARAAERSRLLRAEREPMVCPPEPWLGLRGGGYLTTQLPVLALVKTRSAAHLAELETMRSPSAFEAINGAQNTAWRVNRRILALQGACLEEGRALGGLPAMRPAPRPPKPADIEQNETARRAFRRAARLWREEERRRRSRAVAIALAHRTAERFSRFERLWLPHQYDFRGRLYPVTRLSPQSSDPARALLEFAEGKPLGEEGWKWLAIHLANCGDFEKISKAPLADRVRWVFRNEERIRAAAADPLAEPFWTEADKPWQFLAACFEWADYIHMIEDAGEEAANAAFLSRLPVALDGACSGLQHFSLMLRDEVGGAAVNLAPKPNASDLYAEVAERLRARLEQDLSSEAALAHGGARRPVRELARAWLEFGVSRDLVKRPTMTYGYGARSFGYAEQIVEDALLPRRALCAEGRADWPFADDDPVAPAVYLAGRVAEAIEATVVKAAEAMKWLQGLADEASRRGLPLRWTTPDDFLVLQDYRETKTRLLHTTLCGRVLRLSLREEGEGLDRRRQRQGVAPNVIHSLDACHLRLTVTRALAEGIASFALVHDSFGAHAAYTPRFFQIIREALVALYEESDVPGSLLRDLGADLPADRRASVAPPARGALALGGVLESEFAFA